MKTAKFFHQQMDTGWTPFCVECQNPYVCPPLWRGMFTPLSVRVSEDLATAYQLFFTSLYLTNLKEPAVGWAIKQCQLTSKIMSEDASSSGPGKQSRQQTNQNEQMQVKV